MLRETVHAWKVLRKEAAAVGKTLTANEVIEIPLHWGRRWRNVKMEERNKKSEQLAKEYELVMPEGFSGHCDRGGFSKSGQVSLNFPNAFNGSLVFEIPLSSCQLLFA